MRARALTVRQPWAWAIAHAGKTVENRSRGTRYRGPLLIHAGAGWSARGSGDERILAACADGGHPEVDRRQLPVSAVVAVAELADCHPDAGCCRPWGESSYREACGRVQNRIHHLLLEDIRPLDEPVAATGALGLWTPPTDLLAAVGLLAGVPA